MRGELFNSMMPVAPIPTMPLHSSSKPKLGFSIESIVGRDKIKDKSTVSRDSDSKDRTIKTPPPAHTQKVHSSYYKVSEIPSYHGLPLEYATRTSFMPPQRSLNPASTGFHSPSMMSHYPANTIPIGPCSPPYSIPPYYIGRDYPSYPWIISRQPRLLPYRPQGHQGASFILHQFRKPKRIRTAFSPSQLLTLEHAFEKNHYVVGAERKQLAQDLNLTETQVKVWFQNRRTKHKRQKQEEEGQQTQPSEKMNDIDDDLQMSPEGHKADSDESDCNSNDSCDVTQNSPS